MKKIQDLYKKLWQSLIRPERMGYTLEELRPENHMAENGENFHRFDLTVLNAMGHELAVSTYLPSNNDVSDKKKKKNKFSLKKNFLKKY